MIFRTPISQLNCLGFDKRNYSTNYGCQRTSTGPDGGSWSALAKKYFTRSKSHIYSGLPHSDPLKF